MVPIKYRVVSTLILLVLDLIWLKTYMGPRYNIMINKIQGSEMKVNNIYAFFAYLLMVIGLNTFVLPKLNFKNINVKDCLKYGFLFGIILYGVYDFTCGAVFAKWNTKLALIDVLWGGVVYFLSCYLLKFI